MHRFKHAISLFTLALFVVVIGAGSAFAQTPPPQPSQPAPAEQPKDPAPIQGELTKVDADAKTITVKIASGTEVQFSYNDATEVTGAKDGVAGLATTTASKVTVHFKEDARARTRLATKIMVEPKK